MPDQNQELLDQYNLDEPTTDTSPAPETVGGQSQASLPPGVIKGPDGKFRKAHTHPDRLVRMAKDLGLSEQEIAITPTAELRETVHDATLERLSQRRAEAAEQHVRSQEPVQAPTQEPVKPAPEIDWNGAAENYDEGLIKILKAIWDKFDALDKRTADYEQVRGHVQASANRTVAEQVDAEFAKRPDIFGKGTVNDLAADSPEMTRRKIVYDLAKTYKEGTPGQKIAKAASILYPQPSQPKPLDLSKDRQEEIERWNEGSLSIPTQRTGAAEPNGRAKAIHSVGNLLKENNIRTPPVALDDFPE